MNPNDEVIALEVKLRQEAIKLALEAKGRPLRVLAGNRAHGDCREVRSHGRTYSAGKGCGRSDPRSKTATAAL